MKLEYEVWLDKTDAFGLRLVQCFCGWSTAECAEDCENCDARFDDAVIYGDFLCPGVSLRQGLSEVEVTPMHMDVITVVALILSFLLLGYLVLTLLFPEKF